MGALCRYRYRESYCAHGLVEGRNCVGEESCSVMSSPTKASRRKNDCSLEQWYGLYCAKYQRFFCAGLENCSTAESYMAHLAKFQTSMGRR